MRAQERNLWDPVQNENEGSFDKKLCRISRWQQQSREQVWDPSECPGHMSMKLVLTLAMQRLPAISGRESKCQGKTEWGGEGEVGGWVVWRRCRWWNIRLVFELTFLALFTLHVVMVWLFFPLGTEHWSIGMALSVYGLWWSKKECQGHHQPITPVEHWIARLAGSSRTPARSPHRPRAHQSLVLMPFSLFTPSFSFYLFKKLHILYFSQKQLYLF